MLMMLQPDQTSAIGRPAIAYCVTAGDAELLIREALADAAGRPAALDLETAPTQSEIDRLKALVAQRAIVAGKLKAAKRTKAPDSQVAALKAEAKLLAARIKHAQSAGLDPHRARIRLLQLYGGGRRVAVIDVFRTGEDILKLLAGAVAVIHNAAFDMAFLAARGIELGEAHCTAQAARLTLSEDAMSLESAAEAYLGVHLDKASQTSDWSAPSLSRQQLEYAAQDVVAVWRLAERIFPALGPQTAAYEIQIAATPAAMRMKLRGIRLDLTAHAELMADLEARRIETCESYKQACSVIGCPDLARKVPATPAEKGAALRAILTSDELARWKRTEKSGALSTRRSDLRRAAHYPPVMTLVELSKIDKMLSAFGPTLTALVNPVTGRIHSDYRIAATSSGRATCSRPNLQQAPRDKAFRSLFKAEPGNLLVAADYASMELRAAAHISGDRRMTEAFRNGGDLHRITAGRVCGKKPEDVTSDERWAAKAVNFGSVYGIGSAMLVVAAWDGYGLVISEAEARQWLDVFAQSYPEFIEWRREHTRRCEDAGRIVIGKGAALGAGRFYPLSRLPSGASAYTRACNLPVQGACADSSMLALDAIDRALFEAEIDGGLVAWLHDELVLEVKAGDADRAAAMLQRAMLDAFAETFPGAPLDGLVGAHVGADWASAKG
jgi:DNA polymerase-1